MALSVSLIQTRPNCDKILSDLTDQENTLSFNQLRIPRAKDVAIKRATAWMPTFLFPHMKETLQRIGREVEKLKNQS